MKAFYMRRIMREKMLILGITMVAAAMWLSSATSRAGTFWRQFRATSQELKMQQAFLDQQTQIETAAAAAVENLDPSRTFDSVRLQTELDAIARATGVTNASSEDPRVDRTDQFSINTVQFQVRSAEWLSLVRFYQELVKRSPYIGIEQVTIIANRATPSQLGATLRVSSVEIAR